MKNVIIKRRKNNRNSAEEPRNFTIVLKLKSYCTKIVCMLIDVVKNRAAQLNKKYDGIVFLTLKLSKKRKKKNISMTKTVARNEYNN